MDKVQLKNTIENLARREMEKGNDLRNSLLEHLTRESRLAAIAILDRLMTQGMQFGLAFAVATNESVGVVNEILCELDAGAPPIHITELENPVIEALEAATGKHIDEIFQMLEGGLH
jgi:hypothetical protein